MSRLTLVTPQSDRDLRCELGDAIADRNAADGHARAAKDVADRAGAASRVAADAAARVKADRIAAQRAATERHAKAISDAYRAGSEPSTDWCRLRLKRPSYAPPTLTRTLLKWLRAPLAQEADKAADAAVRANATVAAIVDEIMLGEARVLADEMVAAIETHWRLLDRLAGLLTLDERRPGGARLREMQVELVNKIDRRKRAIAANPLHAEYHNWQSHLDALAADQVRTWTDYARRLSEDPQARFEEKGS